MCQQDECGDRGKYRDWVGWGPGPAYGVLYPRKQDWVGGDVFLYGDADFILGLFVFKKF